MKHPTIVAVHLGVLFLAIPALSTAMYVPSARPSTVKVPTDRLIANLERQFQRYPENWNLAWRLARVHGMAYAQQIDSVEAIRGGDEYFGEDEPAAVHSRVARPRDEEQAKVAQQHLQEAIRCYEVARRLKPEFAPAALGYGWCLEQAGRNREARKVYRRIIDEEFAKTEHPRMTQPGGPYPPNKAVTAEALHYLIGLLNPVWDWWELRTRRRQVQELGDTTRWPNFISPIAIPLGNGGELTDVVRDDIDVRFDLDGSGLDQRWTWIDPTAGWLVHDFCSESRVTSGRDLFGNVTFWIFWSSGFEALAALDDSGDGWLRGAELQGLAIWSDRDSDGVCDARERFALEECGIVALSCTCTGIEYGGRRMWMSRDGVEFANGLRRTSYDVVLHRRGDHDPPRRTVLASWVERAP